MPGPDIFSVSLLLGLLRVGSEVLVEPPCDLLHTEILPLIVHARAAVPTPLCTTGPALRCRRSRLLPCADGCDVCERSCVFPLC
ncbi:hypothetical protein PF005_g15229 [Phytophthora fragariae]|uniref:AMP-dependent synthetase/ligase domain-containing protein n=1 Tax=Phytophthora fragariae TaxID=53985 RepID=A0A6A3FB25_9STRA|nr:hypothetical protein PF003_g17673 [Phytophthora fragariae]KAE8942373.1 hypothetical protein PF009_g7859 [Phytophthora fragariae]KAE8996462.1 hypothetical protein PF011_g15888 [Phytophthora fragariae]KAE9099299.1 hypothetical protein PF010_g15251 [Phytophthora fragariae]KAE9124386.1 hypothetical protein PF007_g6735 [Phytophthora fragariae]